MSSAATKGRCNKNAIRAQEFINFNLNGKRVLSYHIDPNYTIYDCTKKLSSCRVNNVSRRIVHVVHMIQAKFTTSKVTYSP